MEREARILIIEDDPDYQEIIGRLCEEAASEIGKDTKISVASKFEVAQRLLEDSEKSGQPFDLVTIDINLRDPQDDTAKKQGIVKVLTGFFLRLFGLQDDTAQQRDTVEEHKEGLKFLENLKASSPETCALIVSAEVWRTGEYRHIIEAFDKHASAFLEKHKLDREEFKRIVQGALYYAEAIEYKNNKRFRRAEDAWKKAKDLAPELNFPVNVGDILQAVRQNPITGLPSGRDINDRLRRLLDQKEWALLKVRIDHLDSFYDHYETTAGDAVLLFTAGILMNAMSQPKTAEDFIGHTVQNRFILITSSADKAEAIREQSVKTFKEQVSSHYPFKDREGGYKEVPLMRLKIGMVTADDGPFADLPELAEKIAQV
jgi:GGDEF domain-containing protein